MRLTKYLRLLGPEAASVTLHRPIRVIRSWMYLDRGPMLHDVIDLERRTRGRVTVLEMAQEAAERAKAQSKQKVDHEGGKA